MEAVYGRKRQAAYAENHETWMDGFVQLEPESGVDAAVRLAWSRRASLSSGPPPVTSRNGHIEIEPVYGQKGGESKTWMAGFTKLNPEGGIRAVVDRAWRQGTATNDGRLAVLAAAMAPLFETSARDRGDTSVRSGRRLVIAAPAS
jgi:hypothetical protein